MSYKGGIEDPNAVPQVLFVSFDWVEDFSKVIQGIVGAPLFEVKEEIFGGSVSSRRFVPGSPSLNVLLRRQFVRVELDANEMQFSEDQFTLLWAAHNKKLVLVTGTGVTRSISNDPSSLWGGFLTTIIGSVWPPPDAGTFSNDVFNSLQADPHAQSEYLLFCAERDQRLPRVTSETLRIMSALVPDEHGAHPWYTALQNFTGSILTFNYDIALEIAIGRAPKDLANVQAHTQLEQYVVHMHGIFTDDESIVLKQQTYIDAAKVVPGYLVSLADSGCVFLYVGVNGVLSDPDLSPFWRYEQIHHAIQKNRPLNKTHFVIANQAENPPFPADANGNPMPFFRKVLTPTTQTSQDWWEILSQAPMCTC